MKIGAFEWSCPELSKVLNSTQFVATCGMSRWLCRDPLHYFTFSIYLHGRFRQLPWYGSKLTFHGSFHQNPWKQAGGIFTSIEASMEVNGNRFHPCNFVETSMEVCGSLQRFPLQWKLNLRLLPSIAASTTVFGWSFHELPFTPICFYLLPRVS